MKKVVRTEIPRKAIYRLSVYSRCLHRLENNGIHTVSSEVLAKAAGVKPTQLRKDLTYFGQFGTRGLGYEVKQLIEMISELLGTKSLQPVVIVGIGNLGRALLSYRGFEREGLNGKICIDSWSEFEDDIDIKLEIPGKQGRKKHEFVMTTSQTTHTPIKYLRARVK